MANNPYSWSTTAASNANTDGIVAAEGENAGVVNDDQRQIMASLAAFIKDVACSVTAAGSANVITVASNAGFSAYVQGLVVGFTAANNNSGATTLNINSIGAKSLRTPGDTALVGGEIKTGLPYLAFYSTAANAAAGAWILVNPSSLYGGPISGSTGTFSGALTTNTNFTVSSTVPVIQLTDTDTGSDCVISGSSTSGSLLLSADHNNEVVGSAITFNVDGSTVATAVASGWHCGKTGLDISAAGVSLGTAGVFQVTRSASNPLDLNRLSTVGDIAYFRVAGTIHGIIAIDGSGVTTYGSFMGAHWSQFADGATNILRGTVVETVDELADWNEDDQNVHLPKVKISDTPASNAVYGVFASYDDGGDALIGSLGAYMVRIIPGEHVQIGDLLESNGDGCARVQADGIFRASTIAKVTSATVIEAYSDGSFLLPATIHCG